MGGGVLGIGAMVRSHIKRTYGSDTLRQIEKTTGDDLERKGKLPLWSRIRRWWLGWRAPH